MQLQSSDKNKENESNYVRTYFYSSIFMDINIDQPSAYDFVFPVFGGELDVNKNFVPKEIYGAAFYINNDIFVTCGHTAKAAQQHELACLAHSDGLGNLQFQKVLDIEIFDANDSALLTTSIPTAVPYKWLNTELAMLNNIASAGYPYGFNNGTSEVYVRSFKGYVVLVGFYNRFANKPPFYELSYHCPRGLSGAPLIYLHHNTMYVCGTVIGNEITDMVVSSFKEQSTEGNTTSVYEKTESLHRGIAMQSKSFFNLTSRILGGTFLDYLKRNNLIE